MSAVPEEMHHAREAAGARTSVASASFVPPRPPPSSVRAEVGGPRGSRSTVSSVSSASAADESSSGSGAPPSLVDALVGGTPSTPSSDMSSLDLAGAVRRGVRTFLEGGSPGAGQSSTAPVEARRVFNVSSTDSASATLATPVTPSPTPQRFPIFGHSTHVTAPPQPDAAHDVVQSS
eukprot:1213511-Rhodomonas_salina.2